MAYILLAEDNARQAGVFRKWLEGAGHAVRWVANGEEGLRLAALEASPDLVISDIMMPETDGESVVMVLQTLTPHTPVVVVTGVRDTGVVKRIEGSPNVRSVLAKPVGHDAFLAAVSEALSDSQDGTDV